MRSLKDGSLVSEERRLKNVGVMHSLPNGETLAFSRVRRGDNKGVFLTTIQPDGGVVGPARKWIMGNVVWFL